MSETIVADTPEAIEAFTWIALRGALRLENLGMKRRGPSARKIAAQRLGVSARTSIPDMIELVSRKIAELKGA